VDVYFDDLKVTQVKTPIVQVEDYYPFGLTFNSYQRDSSMPDQYLYNGKELQDELSLGWLDYGARMYMPELGRWGVVDPHVEKYESINPYSYNYSNPIRFVDLFGRDPGDIVVLFSGADFGQGKTGSTVAIENEVRKDVNGGKVVSYSSSYYKNLDDGTQEAYDEILRTHKENPKGRILLYGYSYGGVLVNHLAKRLAKAEIQVSVMVTVDAANGWGSDNVDRTISSNVHVNENFFELNPKFTRDPTLSHGHANSGNPGQVKNHDKSNDSYEGEKMDHMNIDEATMKDAVQIFTNILKCLTDGDRKDYDSDQVKELLKKKK
jgi:RHS repeat-associated protein